MKPSFLVLALLAAVAAPSSVAAKDLAELRVSCQEESKRRFRGPSRIKPDVYKIVLERRKAFVRTCMTGPRIVERTASVSRAQKPLVVSEDAR